MQNAEWKLPLCVSMKNIYQVFGEIPVYACFTSKTFYKSVWIYTNFMKITFLTVEVFRRPTTSHDAAVPDPVPVGSWKMMPVWRSWHSLHMRALNDISIAFTAQG